jgi:hypothetical protein
LGATLNVAKPKKGSTVAVFGMGAVGLAVSFLIFLLSSILTLSLLVYDEMCAWFILNVSSVFRLLKEPGLLGLRELLVLI